MSADAWHRAGEIDSTRFEHVDGPRMGGVLAVELDPALRDRLLADPDVLVGDGEILKDDRASTVVVPSGSGEVVLKRFRYPDVLRALRRAPRASRARKAFVATLRLQAFEIGVPQALGYLERRRAGLGTASWLVARRAPGRDAQAVLTDAQISDDARARLVDALAGIVARMQGAGIIHGDLKATNFLVDGFGRASDGTESIQVLDLHAVRRPGVFGRAGLRRDRERFLRNLDAWPELRRRAIAVIDRRQA